MAPVINIIICFTKIFTEPSRIFTDPLFSTLSRITLVTLVTLLVTLLSVTALEL